MKTPILGSSYVARSVNAADNRMVNLFPEVIPEGGKDPGFLQRAPGLAFLQTVGTGPIRGLWVAKVSMSVFYVVSGVEVYKLSGTTATPELIGEVSGTGPVSIADNGTQIFFACNGPSYIYNINTGAFGPITDPDFPGAVTVGFLDGYFVFNEPNSQKVWVTALLDGYSIDPLEYASAEGSPDGLIAVNVDHREAWLFGTNSIEVWYNAGLADFPLARIQGAFNELGCVAAYSVAKLDNTVYWLGRDDRGQGVVYKANGYTGQRVSTHAIEWQIQQYGDISDAIAYTYQQDGHSFYVLTFPSANATWVYDAATQAWHERAGWNNGNWMRHRSNCQCNYNGNIIVGDFENGNIYKFDLNVYADNGQVQRWVRSWRALPTGQNNLNRSAHHSLQLDAQAGHYMAPTEEQEDVLLATESGAALITQDDDFLITETPETIYVNAAPQFMLRWSDDGGHSWSNEHWMGGGAIGQYGTRIIWRRLGMTLKLRDRVYEVSGTDPIKIAIMGAELHASATNA